jgi:hypothetical protein
MHSWKQQKQTKGIGKASNAEHLLSVKNTKRLGPTILSSIEATRLQVPANLINDSEELELRSKPRDKQHVRHCRLETEKKLHECLRESDDEDSNVESDSEAIRKKKFKKPESHEKFKTKRVKRAFKVDSARADPVPEIELKRIENMKRNSDLMKSLGLESPSKTIRNSSQAKGGPKRKSGDAESIDPNWESSDDESPDEEPAAKIKHRPGGPRNSEKAQLGRACKKARPAVSATAAPAPVAPGSELEGRRLRVLIFTEDVGDKAWHQGEILRHRRRRGRDEHLVRWDTDGADDEWLYLPEEEYHVYAEGEEEAEAAERAEDAGAAGGYAPGDCVEVAAGDDGERVSYARLEEARGPDSWLVQWFYEPADLPPAALQTKLGRQVPENIKHIKSANTKYHHLLVY